ncbi:hypothetical protein ACR1PO_15480 [Chryseobacterium sp. RRHN12]|uniref:hypothetical protein n=1 Tax=Chryseobacterium sp. RRHN12 TaxID=3437884 RepID=UPI003D9BE3B8
MKKIKLIFIVLSAGLFTLSCSHSDDEDSNYKELERMPYDIIGDWRPENAYTKVSLTFSEESNYTPKLYISRSGRYFQGRPLYLKGGDGSMYFKFNGSDSYSKLNYKKVVNKTYEFNLENSGDLNFKENFIKQ